MRRFCAVATAAWIVVAGFAPSDAAPKTTRKPVRYDHDILGFNDGDPYRLRGAEAEAVLAEPSAVVFQFQNRDWMRRDREGIYVPVADVVSRYPGRSAEELVQVFRTDLDGDRAAEVILLPDPSVIGSKRRYAATVLSLGRKGGYRATWVADGLPGERQRVVDIRDLNGDGRPEILLSGEAGRSGYYQFHELVGRSHDDFVTFSVRHVDSVHYVDLDRDRTLEIVMRQRVGRKGPATQWTYVDHLYQWTGRRFEEADSRYLRYHDEETLPTLVDSLIDHHDAEPAILAEKVDAIRAIRKQVLESAKKPRGYDRKVVRALQALQKDQLAVARRDLEALSVQYAYDIQVILGLARLEANGEAWKRVRDRAYLALSVDPAAREAWWWLGVAFIQLEERSSAVACLRNLVRLAGGPEEGSAFLRARRGEPGMEANLQQAIDEALELQTRP